MWHNLYVKPFTKVLLLVGCQVKSKILGFRTSEINLKDYKHVQCGQGPCLQSDSYKNQAILYGASKMHKNYVTGTRCVYNWTCMMVDMGLDNIVHNDRESLHARIFNSWIEDWESDIPRSRDQDNEQRLLQKYKNRRFLDDDYNQTYMISLENLEFKGTTRSYKQYYAVGKPLDCRDEDNLDLMISRNINDDFMVLIKGVEQDPDMGVKFFHPSIDDDSEATYSEKEVNNNQNAPKTPYYGEI